jgi:hypothetical protein
MLWVRLPPQVLLWAYGADWLARSPVTGKVVGSSPTRPAGKTWSGGREANRNGLLSRRVQFPPRFESLSLRLTGE